MTRATPQQVKAYRVAWEHAKITGTDGGPVQAGLDAALALSRDGIDLELTRGLLDRVLRGRRLCEAAGLSAGDYTLLRLFSRGLTRQQVADTLGISPNSVSTRTRLMFRKLGVHRRSDALHVTGWDVAPD